MAKKAPKKTVKPVNKPPVKQKYIPTPEIMWQHFLDYIEKERNNPMYKVDYVGKQGQKVLTPLQTPITFEGFQNYLEDIDVIHNLAQYSANTEGRYTAYQSILARIKRNCFVQNLKGASVKLFDSNIIARKLGLTDKVETEISGSLNNSAPTKEKRKATRDKYDKEI